MIPRREVRSGADSPRHGMTLVEVIIAIVLLTGVLLVLGAFSAKFAQANGQAHLIITANEIASARLDDIRTQPTYVAIDSMASPAGRPDSIKKDNTIFLRLTKIRHVGGTAPTDSVDYRLLTVIVTHPSMSRTVSKTAAMAAF